MPARKNKKSDNISKKVESRLFPSGNVDPETKAAFDRMMAVHGHKLGTPGAPLAQTTPSPQIVQTPQAVPAGTTQPPDTPPSMPAPQVETVAVPVDMVRHNKIDAFKKAMSGISASSVYTVKLSDGRELNFEPPRVKAQKTLNQIMASNKNDPAAQYMAQMALIESVCLDKGVDWQMITELDRNKILFTLYRDVLFRGEYTYKCDVKDCGFQWKAKIDGNGILERLDKSDVSDRMVKKVIDGVEYEVRIGFPAVKSMVAFLTDSSAKRMLPGQSDGKGDGENDEVTTAASLLEYVDMFIKEIWVRKDGEELGHISLEDMVVPYGTPVVDESGKPVLDAADCPETVDVGQCYRDVMGVIETLPGALLQAASEDDVYTKIFRMLVGVVNDAMPECICPKCGKRMGKSFGFNDFFALG